MRRVLAVMVMALVSGCGTGLKSQLRRPPPGVSVKGLAVYPVRVTGTPVPGWRAHELGQRVVRTTLWATGEKLPVFGPDELTILRWEDDSWVGSDALPLLVAHGVTTEQGALLKVGVEVRTRSQSREALDAKGAARAAAADEVTTYLVTARIVHPSTKAELASVQGEVTVDPFAPPAAEAEFDPSPPLTGLLLRAVEEAVRGTFPSLGVSDDPSRVAGLVLAESPARARTFPDPQVAAMDPLSAEVWLINRARYLSPFLSDREAGKVAPAPPGLYVMKAPDGVRLTAGDLITSVDGQAPQLQILSRLRLKGTGVQVRATRRGTELDAVVP